MRLGYTLIYVADVPATVEFYERCFDLPRRFLHESNEYAEMETGATALGFVDEALARQSVADYRLNRPADPAAGIEVGLVTDDVPAAYTRALAGGAEAVLEPTQKPWGQWVAYVRDLNGVLVELCTAMGD